MRLLPRTHRQAGFAVLTSPEIPAALVELGYLSNPQDEKLLTVRQHQIALATGAAGLGRRPLRLPELPQERRNFLSSSPLLPRGLAA